jgi:hypothetical protein
MIISKKPEFSGIIHVAVCHGFCASPNPAIGRDFRADTSAALAAKVRSE